MNILLKETFLSSNVNLQLVQGDITTESTDAIVNAANEYLQHGAGVAGAISRRGGPAIQAESDAWIQEQGPVSHAEPAWTSGGKLACRYVIHAVGPAWGDGDEDAILEAAVNGTLNVADGLGLKSISIPAISTGIFGFPKEMAADDIFSAIQSYYKIRPDSGIKSVRVVVFDPPTASIFLNVWHDHFSA